MSVKIEDAWARFISNPRRDAIDLVYELALGFWHKAKAAGMTLDVAAALGYAMQILCADPEAHLMSARPDLWSSEGLRVNVPTAIDATNGGQLQPQPAILRLRESVADLHQF